MRTIIKAKWLIFLAWILLLIGLMFGAPNMEQLVRDKGQITVPEGYPSSIAADILQESNPENHNETAVVLVFHDKKGITTEDEQAIKEAITSLEKEKIVTEVTTHFENKELESELVSDDGKTILLPLSIDTTGKQIKEIRAILKNSLKDCPVDHYFTGSDFISEDVVQSSQDGLHKTEAITLVFILVVLCIVFRSAIAPIIPLITVGFTYLASQSLVAILVDKVNFPLSNFTQIFLVAVLFGIGTDYCILLLSRFKEELSHDENVSLAIINTYRTAGKTVLFSGLAVLVGFASIGLATFKLYQSAVAVAIGVAILLLALVTIVPFFMSVLGKKIFWPLKGNIEHPQSKLWGLAGKFSLSRPLVALGIIVIMIAPFLVKYDGALSFNSLDEIGDHYESVKAFNIISDSFGPGESLPGKIVIKNDDKMDTSEYLALIEKISREVEKVDHVEKVRSATRPVGDELEDLYVKNQVEQLGDGLEKGNEGIKKIRDGLDDAASALTASSPELAKATDGIDELVDGTYALKKGAGELEAGLIQIQNGLKNGTMGAKELKKGVKEARVNAEKLAASSKQLLIGYEKLGAGLTDLHKNYVTLYGGLTAIQTELGKLPTSIAALETAHPELLSDANYLTVKGTVNALNENMTTLHANFNMLNAHLGNVTTSVEKANAGLKEIANGQQAFVNGLDQLITGLTNLEKGMSDMSNGQGQIISKLPTFSNGLGELASGQEQLKTGVGSFVAQLDQLTGGLTDSVKGLNAVSSGLHSAKDYLVQLANADNKEMTGWYIPEDVLKNKDFAQVFDTYMSKDRKVTTLDVIWDINPYSNEALAKTKDIQAAVERATKDTKLENAEVGVAGVSSIFADLQQISDADFSRTVTLMLIGIGIILIILLRSFVMPIYLIGSLILTYFTSAAITEFIFVDLLHYPGMNWAVPFFGFVILMALGVDYSIFLMDRFNEYKTENVEEALLDAMKNMGTVIISAAIILAGTFGAMLPSGVLPLLEIATVILSGLLLYALIFLPLFVPIMVKTFGKANWWPFMK